MHHLKLQMCKKHRVDENRSFSFNTLMNDNQNTFLPLTRKHIVPIHKSFAVFNYFHLTSKHRLRTKKCYLSRSNICSTEHLYFGDEKPRGTEEGKLKVEGVKRIPLLR